MKTNEISINENYQRVLIKALFDKKISAIEFRVFFYISTNQEILVARMQEDLNIKTTNLMSKCIKNLLKEKYIFRQKTKKKVLENTPFYEYSINLFKDEILILNNSEHLNDYFINIEKVYKYFFKKLPTTRKIDIPKNKKSIELLIYKDKKSIEEITKIIDYVSITHFRRIVTRPVQLRKYYKNILQELTNKQN